MAWGILFPSCGKKKFNSIGDREWNDLCKC